MEYLVRTPLKLDETTTVLAGEKVELSPKDARELLAMNAIEPVVTEPAPALAQGTPAPDPDGAKTDAFPDAVDLDAMDLDALILYVQRRFSEELADGLGGTEAQVRDQVRDLIDQAKAQVEGGE
jgi:hypothetical protein